MEHRSFRLLAVPAVAAVAVAAAAALPPAAVAQTAHFYSPPKVLKRGTNTTPVAGSGTVEVKVFVKRDGSVGSAQVVTSTNHADDAAALEIAKTSTYKPGASDAKPGDYFYTYKLQFSGSSVVSDTGSTAADVNAANALLRANKYAEAKADLEAYLAAHPGDPNALALLGTAESFLGNAAAAADDFDRAGRVPPNLQAVALKAYADASLAALKAHDTAHALAYAQKSVALQPTANGYYLEGTSYLQSQEYDKAIAPLEQASQLLRSGNASPSSQAAVAQALAEAHEGVAVQQADAAMKSGNRAAAAAALEAAAAAQPARAANLYYQAAQVLAGGAKSASDWKAVKAEADKALAASPNDAGANYLAGVAAANAGDRNGALPYLQKAKANAGSDAKLTSQVDAALKALGQK